MDLIKENRGIVTFEGFLFIILGILAIIFPVVFTFGFEQLIGWLFFLGGLVQVYRSYKSIGHRGFWPLVFSALLGIVAGLLLIIKPMAGVLTLTLVLTFFFFLEGIAKIAFAFSITKSKGWGWILFSGLIALGLGILILSGWPGTALWVLGLLAGINMLFFGSSLLSLVWSLPKESK